MDDNNNTVAMVRARGSPPFVNLLGGCGDGFIPLIPIAPIHELEEDNDADVPLGHADDDILLLEDLQSDNPDQPMPGLAEGEGFVFYHYYEDVSDGEDSGDEDSYDVDNDDEDSYDADADDEDSEMENPGSRDEQEKTQKVGTKEKKHCGQRKPQLMRKIRG